MTVQTCQETAEVVRPTFLGAFNFPDFTTDAAGPLTITWTNTDPTAVPPTLQDLQIWLSRADGIQVATQAGPNATTSTLTTASLPAGRYFVSIANYTFASQYTIALLIRGPGCPQPPPVGGGGVGGFIVILAVGGAVAGAVLLAKRAEHHPHATAGAHRRRR